MVVGFGRNLKVDCYWLKEGNNSFAIGPHGYIWEGDTGYCVLGVLFEWWRFEFDRLEKKKNQVGLVFLSAVFFPYLQNLGEMKTKYSFILIFG